MKRCPFCAEEIQDAAVVCRHCSRELAGARAGTVTVTAKPAKKRGVLTRLALGLGALFLIGYISSLISPSVPRSTATSNASTTSPTSTTATATPAAPAKPDKWEKLTGQSGMDDSKELDFGVGTETVVNGWLAHEKPILMARCKERKFDVFVVTGMSAQPELGEYKEHSVRVRFDDGPAVREKWSESTDNKALFSPSPSQTLNKIAAAKTVRFEFTPFNANPATVTFDVAGFAPHLTELRTICQSKSKAS